MIVKHKVEIEDEDLNGIYSMLGEAWRTDSTTATHYQFLADNIKKFAEALAQKAFNAGFEEGVRCVK